MSAAVQQNSSLQLILSVIKGPHAGQKFQLGKEKILIGRGPENDIVLINDPLVSRQHAQLLLVEREFEIIRVSQKNSVLVGGESVDKWKLISGASFLVGDSEIKIEYDLGQAVVSIPQRKLTPVPSIVEVKKTSVTVAPPTENLQAPVIKNTTPQPRPMAAPVSQPLGQSTLAKNQNFQSRPAKQVSSNQSDTKFLFYMIAALVIGTALIFLLSSPKSKKVIKSNPTLKYEDDIAIKLNSTPEKELIKKREDLKIDRNSPQFLRAQENFIKGMRDYNLGNYARAIEFFQVVLNLDSGHALAKRHIYLSRIRFDELVQVKLMLGESYYNKHNFNMCRSMYQQVMDMLDDKKSDTKYKLAEGKAKECELASQGIR